MELTFPYTISVRLPSDLEIIPSIRKFVSEVLQVSGFSAKFAFRSEIIVDAICNNAITYGSEGGAESEVEASCVIYEDRMEIVVKDSGGTLTNIERLKDAVRRSRLGLPLSDYGPSGMGLEIVKLLSETIELNVDENNVTSIHVVRKREEVSQAS
ncbi:MAG: ATP-binding protein [Chitinispirillales bacterium]|jgi:anti-sigma regulatory factor (Ser/Thr protein kinase)|nr:ATP-binding protein [Chitinispirillales bacterium]